MAETASACAPPLLTSLRNVIHMASTSSGDHNICVVSSNSTLHIVCDDIRERLARRSIG